MKIFICYDMKDTPHGGANQFLKALKKQFKKNDSYADNVPEADVVLYNSHHDIKTLIQIKDIFPNKIYVHRIDGPMKLYNNMNDERDHIVYHFNKLANATVFQSQWSYEQNLRMGLRCKKPSIVIYNAPDPNIFNTDYEKKENDKLRLIATSWSDNPKKGFKYYDFLDKNLNFDKYEVYFAGRSPINFKNINVCYFA